MGRGLSLSYSSSQNYFASKALQRRYCHFQNIALQHVDVEKEAAVDRSRSWSRSWSQSRFFQAGVRVGVGVAEIWSNSQH